MRPGGNLVTQLELGRRVALLATLFVRFQLRRRRRCAPRGCAKQPSKPGVRRPDSLEDGGRLWVQVDVSGTVYALLGSSLYSSVYVPRGQK